MLAIAVSAAAACTLLPLAGAAESTSSASDGHSDGHSGGHSAEAGGHHGPHPHVALCFFFVAIIMGCVTARLAVHTPVPYTGILLLEGMVMGLIHEATSTQENYQMTHFGLGTLSESLEMWIRIDPHLLLYAFLPGLLFGDASTLNLLMVKRCFWQCLLLAGPGVLLGSFLTACVAHWGPYKWDWYLSMMIGSICAATDPVAVVGLLKEMGASSKLTMLIAGESLMNDGTAIVLFTLFLKMYENCTYGNWILLQDHGSKAVRELLDGLPLNDPTGMAQVEESLGYSLCDEYGICQICKEGQDHKPEEIVQFFFQMAIAAIVTGAAMGLALLFVIGLVPNSIRQISLTIAASYCAFFVAENNGGMSGVLACVAISVVFAAYAWPSITSHESMHHVWHTIEFLGNTVLFMLSGVIAGALIWNMGQLELGMKDVGYLLVFYVALTIIRSLVLLFFYPALSRLGQGVSLKELSVMSWGGLRGAVGIALAIAVFNTPGVNPTDGARLMFHSVGIATLTLLVNGTTCPYLLNKLRLLEPTAGEIALELAMYRVVRVSFGKCHAEMCKRARFSEHNKMAVKMYFNKLLHHQNASFKDGTGPLFEGIGKEEWIEDHMTEEEKAVYEDASAILSKEPSHLMTPSHVAHVVVRSSASITSETRDATDEAALAAVAAHPIAAADSAVDDESDDEKTAEATAANTAANAGFLRTATNAAADAVNAAADAVNAAADAVNTAANTAANAAVTAANTAANAAASAANTAVVAVKNAPSTAANAATSASHNLADAISSVVKTRKKTLDKSRTMLNTSFARVRDEDQAVLSRVKSSMRALDDELVVTVRELFLNCVKAHYWELIEEGFVPSGFPAKVLLESVDRAKERCGREGAPLCDWDILRSMTRETPFAASCMKSTVKFAQRLGLQRTGLIHIIKHSFPVATKEVAVFLSAAFHSAHRFAAVQVAKFVGEDEFIDTPEEKLVIDESLEELGRCEHLLKTIKEADPFVVKKVQTEQCISVLQHHLKKVILNYEKEGAIHGRTRDDLLHCIGLTHSH